MHRTHNAPYVDVHVAVLTELSDFLVIFPQTYDGEFALRIWCIGGTNVQISGSIRYLDDIVDVSCNADVLIYHLDRFGRRHASFLRSGHKDSRCPEGKKHQHAQAMRDHDNSFRGMERY